MADENISGARQYDHLHRVIKAHHRRHASRDAESRRPIAGPARFQVALNVLPYLLIFRGEWRLARKRDPVVGIAGADPLTLEVGVLVKIDDLRARGRCEQGDRQGDRTDRDSVSHGILPHICRWLHASTPGLRRALVPTHESARWTSSLGFKISAFA